MSRADSTARNPLPGPRPSSARRPQVKVRPDRRVDAFVVCQPGLEQLVLDEVVRLGVRPARQVRGGVECTVTWPQLWAINLWSRVGTRVLVRVASFGADGFDTLRLGLDRVDWDAWLPADDGRGIRLSVSTDAASKLFHSEAVGERVAEAAGRRSLTDLDDGPDDMIVEAAGDAPRPALYVRVLRNRVTVSLDASGDSLHRRGWRGPAGKAPLRETLAAALLIASGWDRGTPLIDPMCGSGTLVIEGALAARRIAPGRLRGFAFQTWPTFDADGWQRQVATADSNVLQRCPIIVGSDRDDGAVQAAGINAAAAGVGDQVTIERRSVSELALPAKRGAIVTNPPYGKRIGDDRDLRNLYDKLGQVLGERAGGWRFAVLATPETPTERLRLGLETVLHTSNGGLPVAVLAGDIPGNIPG